MEIKNKILPLFHHIHHTEDDHKVHHCGGEHPHIATEEHYTIHHCPCGKHRIDREVAIGHATDKDLLPMEITVKFLEPCPSGGWHIESGVNTKIKE